MFVKFESMTRRCNIALKTCLPITVRFPIITAILWGYTALLPINHSCWQIGCNQDKFPSFRPEHA